MFVEGAAAAGDHVFLAALISLAEDCAEANCAEVAVNEDWAFWVKTLERSAWGGDCGLDLPECFCACICPFEWGVLLEKVQHGSGDGREVRAEAAIVTELAECAAEIR